MKSIGTVNRSKIGSLNNLIECKEISPLQKPMCLHKESRKRKHYLQSKNVFTELIIHHSFDSFSIISKYFKTKSQSVKIHEAQCTLQRWSSVKGFNETYIWTNQIKLISLDQLQTFQKHSKTKKKIKTNKTFQNQQFWRPGAFCFIQGLLRCSILKLVDFLIKPKRLQRASSSFKASKKL